MSEAHNNIPRMPISS